jgi:hypothetical protein
VEDGIGERMEPGESRPFEISGPGVRTDGQVTLSAGAWVR